MGARAEALIYCSKTVFNLETKLHSFITQTVRHELNQSNGSYCVFMSTGEPTNVLLSADLNWSAFEKNYIYCSGNWELKVQYLP